MTQENDPIMRGMCEKSVPGQPFAFFVGSGDETRFGGLPGGPIPVY